MIKLTITTKNGTTVLLDIPDTEEVTVTQEKVESLIQPVEEKPEQPIHEPKPLPNVDHTPETPLDEFQFPCQTGMYVPPEKLTRDFVLAFGQEHVAKEFLKARLWLLANPDKLKTARGMGRYLNAWLSREAGMKRVAIKEATKTGSLLDEGQENHSGW